MREPPTAIDPDEVIAAVRREWDADVVRVEHLPLGFGAHHWVAHDVDRPLLCVTFDRLRPDRPVEDLEAAYAGAVALRRAGLEFVLAPLPSRSGSPLVPFADGALSCTPWERGRSGGELDVDWTGRALRRLHAAQPPNGIPRWSPLVDAGLAAEIRGRVGQPWGPGPYADAAREAVRKRLTDLDRWVARYHELVPHARRRAWVVTHGEPHSDNQLVTPDAHYLLDWESLMLAPRERDLGVLLDAGGRVDADPEMIEMFDLQWRLDEIQQYVAWFAAPHQGTEDDRIAFTGLLDELDHA